MYQITLTQEQVSALKQDLRYHTIADLEQTRQAMHTLRTALADFAVES